MQAPQKLHVLVVIASLIVALRGLQLLQLLGIIPKLRGRSAFPSCALQVNPVPPFQTASSTRELQQLVHWLNNHGAIIDGSRVHSFAGLRGLQAMRDYDRHEVILAIPTALTVSFGTFSAASAAAKSPLLPKLLALPDGDMYLEVVALLQEALLYGYSQRQAAQHSIGASGSNSSSSNTKSSDTGPRAGTTDDKSQGFGAYLATLPQAVDLPLFLDNSKSSCGSLLTALPHLQRLTSKRMADLKAAWPRVQALLRALPKPSAAALARLNPCQAWQAFLWAYSIAKTRVVTLEVEELPAGVSDMLQQRGVTDVGVMVPMLDMANHAGSTQVNARVVGDSTSFRLVATQTIKQGQQVFISYNPSDDENPNCSWRWLLEYSFIPGSADAAAAAAANEQMSVSGASQGGEFEQQQSQQHRQQPTSPHRQCFEFNLTAAQVLSEYIAAAAVTTGSDVHSSISSAKRGNDEFDSSQWQQLLPASGRSDASTWVDLTGTGILPDNLITWISEILQAYPLAHGTTLGETGTAASSTTGGLRLCGCSFSPEDSITADARSPGSTSSGGNCVAACVLQHVLKVRRQQLQYAVKRAEDRKQHQQGHSCTMEQQQAGAETTGIESSNSVGTCTAMYGEADISSSESSKMPCSEQLKQGLLHVASDADAALTAALTALQSSSGIE